MYDNHECTALEVEARAFNEKILALADRIKELEAQSEARLRMIHEVNGCVCRREGKLEELQAQLDRVRELPRYKMTLPSLTQKHFKTVPDESGDWVRYSDIKSITRSKDDE